MNGKTAKKLEQRARQILLALNKNPSEGCNKYKQAINCRTTEQKYVEAIKQHVTVPTKGPGTVYNEWTFKIFYKFLKKIYKKGGPDAKTLLSGSEEDLLNMFSRIR
jgi:hypothetical protein